MSQNILGVNKLTPFSKLDHLIDVNNICLGPAKRPSQCDQIGRFFGAGVFRRGIFHRRQFRRQVRFVAKC